MPTAPFCCDGISEMHTINIVKYVYLQIMIQHLMIEKYIRIFIRTSNFSLRLDLLIFVLNFRPKCSPKVLKTSRLKFVKPINKDYWIS